MNYLSANIGLVVWRGVAISRNCTESGNRGNHQFGNWHVNCCML